MLIQSYLQIVNIMSIKCLCRQKIWIWFIYIIFFLVSICCCVDQKMLFLLRWVTKNFIYLGTMQKMSLYRQIYQCQQKVCCQFLCTVYLIYKFHKKQANDQIPWRKHIASKVHWTKKIIIIFSLYTIKFNVFLFMRFMRSIQLKDVQPKETTVLHTWTHYHI